jgi:sugar/nucleoside kinase (ribokinase family)
MTSVAITGYASLDYVVRLDRPPVADATATILSRPAEWPRLGGSPAYVAAAMIAAGIEDVTPIGWVGDDEDGALYRETLAARGVNPLGIAICRGRTPVCMLSYQPDGGCHCYYHPSLPEPLKLTSRQLDIIADARWLCLTVGPAEATARALEATRPDARVVWAVKADPRAAPPELAAAIAARADVITASRREAAFLEAALAAAGPSSRRRLILETRGSERVVLRENGGETLFPADPVNVEDSTGAGDTFLGGFLAALIKGNGHPVAAGARAARAMLSAREATTKENGQS